MANINQNDYNYYLHKTLISTPETIESLFNDGLKSRYNYSLHSTLFPVDKNDLEQRGLEKIITEYLGNGDTYNSVVVVKIPSKYFSNVIHRDGKIDPPVPFFREYTEKDWDWNALLSPKLVQGVYCRDINKSFENPNFCPIFYPDGCQFSNEQIQSFESVNAYDWREFALSRRNYSFQQLYTNDKRKNIWNKIVNYYSQLYGIQPRQMLNYEMPEEDKNLFSNKAL